MRQDKTENDVVIEMDRGENCDTVNGISGSQIVTGEKETRINSLNPVAIGKQFHDSESGRSQIQKLTYDDKDDTCNSESSVVTVEKETIANSLVPVASGE